MPKTFTADIGNVSFPGQNFQRPLESNTGTMEAAKQVAQTAIELDTGISTGMLRGEESSDTLVVGGIPIAKGTKLPDADSIALANEVEGELSLRKVKRMRDQGVLSASGAKILAAQAVQAASARRPGLAAEFRKTASGFFGDFGEGQGTLNETASEKQAASEAAMLRKEAISRSEYTLLPDGSPSISAQNLKNTQRAVARENTIKAAQGENVMAVIHGDKSIARVDLIGRTAAVKATDKVMGLAYAQITQTGSIKDYKALEASLALGRRTITNEINKGVKAVLDGGGHLTQAQIKQAHESAEAEFKAVESNLKSQSWQEVAKVNKEGLSAYVYNMGVAANPSMAAQEAAAPGSTKFLVELAPKWAEMSPTQREVYFQRDPWAREVWNTQAAAAVAGRSISAAISGMFPDFKTNPAENAQTIYSASHIAASKDGKNDPNVQGAITGLQNEVAKGNIAALHTLLDPKVRPNITPESKKEIMRSAANEAANLVVTVPGLLAEYDAYELKFDGKDFVPSLSEKGRKMMSYERAGGSKWVIEPGMAAAPTQLKDAAKALNLIVRGLTTYGNDPETGTTFKEDPLFKEAFRGMAPEDYANLILKQIDSNSKTLREFRKANEKPKVSAAQQKVEEQMLRKQYLKEQGISE
jgi:hypothetical protein